MIFRSDLRGGQSKQTTKFIETVQFLRPSGTAFFGKAQVRGLFPTRMLTFDPFNAISEKNTHSTKLFFQIINLF
jgi:hypothetical protein